MFVVGALRTTCLGRLPSLLSRPVRLSAPCLRAIHSQHGRCLVDEHTPDLGAQKSGRAGVKSVVRCCSTATETTAFPDVCTAMVDVAHMREALQEAHKAAAAEEVPVGAVLVYDGKVVARAHNQTEVSGIPTAHAEMLCIAQGATKLGGWRLLGCTLYVTTEPCPMCAGAILQSRVGTLVYGARNPLLGADGSWVSLLPQCSSDGMQQPQLIASTTRKTQPLRPHPFHPDLQVRRAVLEDDCAVVMKLFFKRRRQEQSATLLEKHSQCQQPTVSSNSVAVGDLCM